MLVEHLKRVFAERCRKNQAYSLRAFSRSLGMDSSTVSAIMNGKRQISLKLARKLIDGLQITDPNQAQTLIVQTLAEDAAPTAEYAELALEQAEAIASWEHFAILAVLELKGFSGRDRAISERLNIPLGIVWECLGRLEKLGLVSKRRTGWVLTGKNMSTGQQVPSGSLREALRQNINKALESLDQDPIELRDISGMTMAISKERLDEARKMIKEFRRRMATYLETGPTNAVYRLNVQLFPLSKESKP